MWVTQMNHIVMEIDQEPYRDWFSSQVRVARAGHQAALRSLDPRSMSSVPGDVAAQWARRRPALPGAACVLPLGGAGLGKREWRGGFGGTSGESGQGGETPG